MLVLECEKTGTRYELGYGGFEMLRWKVAQIHGKALRKVQDAFTSICLYGRRQKAVLYEASQRSVVSYAGEWRDF